MFPSYFIFSSLLYVFQCVPPWIYSVWDSVHFLDLIFSCLILGRFSSISSSNIFSGPFSSPSGIPIKQMLHLLNVRYCPRGLRLSSFLFILFSLYCLVAVISSNLSSRSLICSSASVILQWIPSSAVSFQL